METVDTAHKSTSEVSVDHEKVKVLEYVGKVLRAYGDSRC